MDAANDSETAEQADPVSDTVVPEDGKEADDGKTAEQPQTAVGEAEEEAEEEPVRGPVDRSVIVNGELIVMRGKPDYVFIDVFDYIDFDLSDCRGRAIVTLVNEKNAFYTQILEEGDEIVIRWEES